MSDYLRRIVARRLRVGPVPVVPWALDPFEEAVEGGPVEPAAERPSDLRGPVLQVAERPPEPVAMPGTTDLPPDTPAGADPSPVEPAVAIDRLDELSPTPTVPRGRPIDRSAGPPPRQGPAHPGAPKRVVEHVDPPPPAPAAPAVLPADRPPRPATARGRAAPSEPSSDDERRAPPRHEPPEPGMAAAPAADRLRPIEPEPPPPPSDPLPPAVRIGRVDIEIIAGSDEAVPTAVRPAPPRAVAPAPASAPRLRFGLGQM